jgi:biopolymer transport protein ExbD
MSMGGDGGGDGEPLAEINVTPMVDVLLSLLIIFMVASPKPPNENIPINVPKESPTQLPSDPNATLLVKVYEDGSAELGKEKLSRDFDQMVEQFKANEKAQTDNKVAVKAEGKIKYGDVVRVMAAAHEAGIADVGIASDKF